MVCGVYQQIKSIHHSSFLYENSDFPTFYPATFSSCVCHQGAYRFGSPVYLHHFKYDGYQLNTYLRQGDQESVTLIIVLSLF